MLAGAWAKLRSHAARRVASTFSLSTRQDVSICDALRHPQSFHIHGAEAVVGCSPLAQAQRGFYFPRNKWFPWRVRLIRQRQAALRQRRHIWPRRIDPEEKPIFGDKEEGSLPFRDKHVRLSLKRMLEYTKLIRGRQLQDAIDYVESMGRMKSQHVLKLLRRAMMEVSDKYKWDIARVYITTAFSSRGYFVKSIRRHTRARFGINKAPRHLFNIRVREMPLEEYFHRLYIYGKVPLSLSSDMRRALSEHRVSNLMKKEWAPYLTANSRFFHRRSLKYLDATRQFDYYEARKQWIYEYEANRMRSTTEAREARGLPPLPT
mmetsp:Transcript_19666/g.45855  ORF Transcript_19666/g.45855 Transcript_19666/m.45855 type:complete len:319 (-) Transcript_19666:76-1032(-)